jgi:hypothetical protein
MERSDNVSEHLHHNVFYQYEGLFLARFVCNGALSSIS